MVTSTPTRTRQRDTKKIRQEAADIWVANKALGWRMTGLELGEQFGFTDSWGRGVIREIENPQPETAPEPSEPEQQEPDLVSTEPMVSLPPIVTPQEVPPTPPALGASAAVAPEPSRNEAEGPQIEGEKHRKLFRSRAPREVRPTASKRVSEPRVPNPQRRGASFASWIAFGLGITVSVAANVAHIWFVIRPDGQAALYAAMILAAFWPLALAVSVEVISRVGYPRGWGWAMARFGGIGAVGAVAAVVSYLHMHSLLNHFGEMRLSAIVGPLGVDGLLIVGGFALFAIGETRKAAQTDVSLPPSAAAAA